MRYQIKTPAVLGSLLTFVVLLKERLSNILLPVIKINSVKLAIFKILYYPFAVQLSFHVHIILKVLIEILISTNFEMSCKYVSSIV